MKRTAKGSKLQNSILIIGIMLALAGIVFANLAHFFYKMNADIASEAVLAEFIWESGEWIPKEWYSSTEVRILGTPNLASLFVGMTGRMSLAMGIACIIMTFSIVGSVSFFIIQTNNNISQKLLFVLLCLVLPNHFVTLELFYLWAGYYAIHVIILFLTLAMYIRLLKNETYSRGDLAIISILAVFSFVLGMQGTRNILILTGPLFVVETLRAIHLFVRKKYTPKDFIVTGWTFEMLLVGYLGTCLPISIGQGFTKNIRSGLEKFVEVVIPDVLACIGFYEVSLTERIFWVIGIGLLAVEICRIILKIFFEGDELPAEDWIMLFMIASPFMTAIFVAFTTIESSERYYFMVLFAVGYAIIRTNKRLIGKYESISWGGYCLAVILLILRIDMIYIPMFGQNDLQKDVRYEVITYLIENDYQYAYATFENANTMTAIADGDVRVAAVASVEKQDVCKWLSSSSWYVPQVSEKGKTAYVVTEKEKDVFSLFLKQHQDDVSYETQIDKFLIYTSDYNFSNMGE